MLLEVSEILNNILQVTDFALYRGFPDWSVRFFGRGAKHITGYSSEDFSTGTIKWIDLVYPDDKERISDIIRQSIAHKKKRYFRTYRVVTSNGEVKWIRDQGRIVYDSAGKFVYMDGLILDITNEKKLEQILERGKRDWELIFDSLPNPIVMANLKDGSCICGRVNKAFADRLGLRPQDVVNKACIDLIWNNSSICEGWKSFDKKEIFKFDTEIPSLNGHFHIIRVPIINGAKEIERLICIFTDITDIKEVEKRLLSLGKELSFVIDAVSVVVISIDEKGYVKRWNNVAEKIFGVPSSEVVGRFFSELSFKGDFTSRLIPAYKRCIETKETIHVPEVRFYTKDETKVLDLTVRPFLTFQNEYNVFIIGFDVTERKNLEMMLVHSQKLESMGALAAGIAHEINTPCQCIMSNLSFLRDELHLLVDLSRICEELKESIHSKIKDFIDGIDVHFLASEIPQALNQSMDCLNRIFRIVDSIREFSHPGSQDRIAVDIHRLLRSAVEISRNEWKYVAEIKFDLDETLPPVVCYPNELSQVFLNLIVNAVHAIKEAVGEPPVNKGVIVIRTRKRDSWCEISISDTGIGIPKEIQHKVFEPFFTTKPVGKGSGQGLAISQAIIMKKHNGHIYFETEEGKGTTFFVRIPLTDAGGDESTW